MARGGEGKKIRKLRGKFKGGCGSKGVKSTIG